MSTRSGKRIHGSFFESTLDGENEHILSTDRKTRSKRQKENGESLEVTLTKTKKRKNYVSYPKDGESISGVEMPIRKEEEAVRVLRKTVLKEQNWNVSSTTEHADVFDDKRPARRTRHTKRFAENNVEDAPPNNTMQAIEMEVDNGQTFKGKKKKRALIETNNEEQEVVKVSNKKSKKKKKKSSQLKRNVKNITLNNSSISLDSFHSAAGSPANENKANTMFDKAGKESDNTVAEHEITKVAAPTKRKRSSANNIVENINGSLNESGSKAKRYSKRNSTFEIITDIEPVLNSTFNKENSYRKSNIKDDTFDKTDTEILTKKNNSTFEKNDSKISVTPSELNTSFNNDMSVHRKSLRRRSTAKTVDTAVEKNYIQQSDINTTLDKLNSTFDKPENENKLIPNSKLTLMGSNDNSNLTSDKSEDGSRISITSVDSRAEHIVNITPVLIESSMDESVTSCNTSAKQELSFHIKPAATPLKREGTFTKDGPEVSHSPKLSSEGTDKTPIKQMTLPSPGSTPFPFSKSSQKEKCMLNMTHSLEKVAARKSFSVEPGSRSTRVMFCSPVNNPATVMQQKGKVIKSNLKGSNKSFVFEDRDTSVVRAAPRKRSYTQNDADDVRVKRKRFVGDQQQSVDRLSRPRTSSSTGKPTEPSTPAKKTPTPAQSKSDSKVSRTKLPNFAALHQRRFDKMESLGECQQRKARRARQLLTPTGAITVLQRSSPRGDSPTAKEAAPLTKRTKTTETPARDKQPKIKPQPPPADTFKTNLPTLESVKPGYTRFGFKINSENPFSIPSMTVTKPKENRPNGALARQATLPSLAGTTSSRRELAKQTVMREKSFTLKEKRDVKRNENRTIIKGVRTNRRFDLQMKMRNIS